MATVQISFTDASNNEESFTIYRSDDGVEPVVDASKTLATLTWDGTQWVITDGQVASGVTIEAGSSTLNPENIGQTFNISYDENNSGTYKYAIVATNQQGNSPTVISQSEVVI